MTKDEQAARDAAIKEIYRQKHKEHFPKQDVLLPSRGSFSDETFKAAYDAGYYAARSEWVDVQDRLPELHETQHNKWFLVTIEYLDDGQIDREVALGYCAIHGGSHKNRMKFPIDEDSPLGNSKVIERENPHK